MSIADKASYRKALPGVLAYLVIATGAVVFAAVPDERDSRRRDSNNQNESEVRGRSRRGEGSRTPDRNGTQTGERREAQGSGNQPYNRPQEPGRRMGNPDSGTPPAGGYGGQRLGGYEQPRVRGGQNNSNAGSSEGPDAGRRGGYNEQRGMRGGQSNPNAPPSGNYGGQRSGGYEQRGTRQGESNPNAPPSGNYGGQRSGGYEQRGTRQGESNPNAGPPSGVYGGQRSGGYEQRGTRHGESNPNAGPPSGLYGGQRPGGYEQRGTRRESGPGAAPPSGSYGRQRPGGYGEPGAGGHRGPSAESRETLQRINRERAGGGRGINSRPLPSGEVSRHGGGDYSLSTRTGRAYSVRPNGSLQTYRGHNNTEAHFRPDGSVRAVRRNEMSIFHGPANSRRIVRERPDHSRFVANGAGHGYIQRSFSGRHGPYVQRTFYHNRAPYMRFYRPFSYHGLVLHRYVPARYHSPFYYSWVFSPWRMSAVYRWGWFGAPWYSYYGSYFSPYRAYPSASFWLADFVLASTLEAAYSERMDAGYREPLVGSQQLTPEVKPLIADEVQRQLLQEQAEGQAIARNNSGDSAAALPDVYGAGAPRVLLAAEAIEPAGASVDCTIMPGDVVQLYGTPTPDATTADIRVVASAGNGCPVGTVVPIALNDLQEMQNHMRATIDEGLADLRARQGRDGIPPAPAAALRGDIDTSYSLEAPPPDPNGAAQLGQEVQNASQAEQEVIGEAFAQEAEEPAASTGTQPLQSQPATVWVFRTKGNVFRPSVFVNGEDLVRLGGGRRCMLVLPPGPAAFQLDNPRGEVLSLDLMPGEVYYLEGRFSSERKDHLEIVHPARGEQEIRTLPPVEAQWIKRPDLAIAQ